MNSIAETTSADRDIRSEPDMQQLLSRMPQEVASSFSDLQLIHLKMAIGGRQWGSHKLDIRGTLTLPFTRWRYYYVFLFGRNRRRLSDREKQASLLMTAVILLLFFSVCIGIGLLGLYLVKSFAGIDLFPSFSLGIWDYFKDNF